MRGDGTCSVVSRSIAAVKALLSSTGLFHHGDVGNRSVIVGVNLEQNAKLVALEVVLNHSVTTPFMALFLLVTGCIAQVEAAPRNIRLLPGYVHRRAQGIDSMVGSISQKERKNGLVIHYDIGRLAGVYAECSDCGWTDGEIRHRKQLVGRHPVTIVFTPSKRLVVSFPDSHANFYATIRNEADLTDVLLMVLTYTP